VALKAVILLTIIVMSLFGIQAAKACDRELNVVYFNSAPYHFEDSEGKLTGLDVDILEAVLTAAGCTWRYTKMPLKRSLSALRAGLIDVAMGASITPEREGFAYFTHPYRRELVVMFIRKQNTISLPTSLSRLTDLTDAKLRIGSHLGSWYGYEYARLFERNAAFREQVLQSVDYENLYRALLAERVDVVIDDIFNGHALLARIGALEATDVHPYVVNDSVTHFMLSRKSVPGATVAIIDAAIEAFQKSDRYREVITHYVPEEYLSRYPLLGASPALPPERSERSIRLMAR
jgi:polar amino acid transport system substrate-binding protein